MTLTLTSGQVWEEIENELFAVLGMVNAKNESRTVGIVYIVRDQKLYIGTGANTWKTRHVKNNPHVSITIPIAKRIPLMPWFKIPAATITFSGTSRVINAADTPRDLLQAVFRNMAEDQDMMADSCVIEVIPANEFITYGIGIPLMQMRFPEKARGRAPVK